MNRCAAAAHRRRLSVLLGALALGLWSCSPRESPQPTGPSEPPILSFSDVADADCVVNFGGGGFFYSSCPWSATINRPLQYWTGVWEVVFDHPMHKVMSGFNSIFGPQAEGGPGPVVLPHAVLTAYDAAGGMVASVVITVANPPFCATAECLTVINDSTGSIVRVRFETANQLDLNQLGGFGKTPPPLLLNCTPSSVVRGAATSCTASTAVPEATLAVQGWTFQATNGLTVVRSTSPTDLTWQGLLVTSGTVTVTALVNGISFGSSTSVTAAARNWTNAMPYPAPLPLVVPDASAFPNLPVHDSAATQVWPEGGLAFYSFGVNHLYAGGNGEILTHFDNLGSGPNEGVWYLKDPPSWYTPVVRMSTYLEPGDPFYEAQTGKRQGEANPPKPYTGWCTKSKMNTLKQQVFDHEGAISGPRLSHHEFILTYTAQRDPGPVFEGIAFVVNGTNFTAAKDTAFGKAYLDAYAVADKATVHAPSNLDPVTCKAHYP